jgi:hypothetical protein
VVDGDTATGTVCDDYRDATFADATKTYTPAEAGLAEPRYETVTLTRAGDRWIVAKSEVSGSC